MRIGLDIDGVIANFNKAYIRLLNDLTGKAVPLDFEPQQWFWAEDAGFTADENAQGIKTIEDSQSFWGGLDLLCSIDEANAIADISEYHETYFITNRHGIDPRFQTEWWLQYHILPEPTTLITRYKGLACYILNIDLYIDDNLENIEDVQNTSPSTRAYLINRPYNRARDVLRRADTLLGVFQQEGLVE